MDEMAVTVQSDGEPQRVTGRVAQMILRLVPLAEQINGELKGRVTLNFYRNTLTVNREYLEEA